MLTKNKDKKYLVVSIAVIVIIAIFAVGFWVGKGQQEKPTLSDTVIINKELGNNERVDFSLFWQVLKRIEENFADKENIDYKAVLYGAISGMTDSLDDPYTIFMEPKKTDSFLESVNTGGSFEGVGMEIGIKDGILTVVTPLEGTPAMKSGIKAGDKVLKVDEESTEGLLIEEAVSLIRGEKGTEVILTVARAGAQELKEISIIRDEIQIPISRWELKGSDVAYVKIYHFTGNLPEKFESMVSEIKKTSAKKIVLDLRNNPGGYLEVATDVASWFMPKGEIVAIEDFAEEEYQKNYRSKGYSGIQDYPMVVLINRGSASASEILAGALRDSRAIELIGEISFGKGSVQSLEKFGDGSSLKVTVAKWLTPSGLSISDEGLVPDIEIELNEEDYEYDEDPQLDRALEELRKL